MQKQKEAVAAAGRRRMTQSGSLIRGIMLTEETAGEKMTDGRKTRNEDQTEAALLEVMG